MDNEKNCKLLLIAFMTGFFGDFILQRLVKNGYGNWGLSPYFKQHGENESLFIAAAMMYLFYALYFYVFQLPFKIEYLAVYGIILDYIFRKTMLFPSLKGYYNNLNYFWSAFWGAIPMILPLIIFKIYEKEL